MVKRISAAGAGAAILPNRALTPSAATRVVYNVTALNAAGPVGRACVSVRQRRKS